MARALTQVTLACIDTVNHALALRALQHSRARLDFARTVLFTDALPPGLAIPEGVEIVAIPPLRSRDDYSQFVLKGLGPHCTTTHLLLVQWDGYVNNPDAWDDAWLATDYLGAQWFWFDDGMRVGNGGFSLRSRRLLDALTDPRVVLDGAEDTTIGRSFRPLLERDHGIRFGDETMADRFAFEAAYPIGQPFGFHGLFNFCRVMPAAELAALVPTFSDAIARSPQFAALLRNCQALAQWQAVIAIGRRMLAATPDHAVATLAIAGAEAAAARGVGVARNDPCPCGSGKRYKLCHGAVDQKQTAFAPTINADELAARGVAVHRRGDLAQAERDYVAALTAVPSHPLALHYLGVIRYQQGRLDAALPMLREAVALVPLEPEFHNNLGLALTKAGELDAAVAALEQTLALSPAHAGAANNLGLALQLRNDLPAAIAAYRRAITLRPDFAQAHWNLGLALLTAGEHAEGWREYEWRLRVPELVTQMPRYAGPRWDGGNIVGQTLLLTAEQGLGDTIQAVRFAALATARGARVVVAAPPALHRLLATVPGVAAVCAPTALPDYDCQLAMMSLPGVLKLDGDTLPTAIPYLRADAALQAALGATLAEGSGRRVGVCWSGAPGNTYNWRRSLPPALLAPLFALPGITWFSLQRESDEQDLISVPGAAAVERVDARNNFDGTAALITQLDLIISVDTSIAHLAGALGKPVWIALPYSPDWRWGLGRSDSPWYPQARLFRQPAPGAWKPVMDALIAALHPRRL